MGFIRIKKINGQEYAYLVENKWYKRGLGSKGKGSRQSSSKYLGKVHHFEKASEQDFFSYKGIASPEEYIVNTSQDEVIKDLIRWEVQRHNVDTTQFHIDFNGKRITKDGKEVALKLNEGFLCSYTMRRLFNLKKEESFYLARCFIEAGIGIPKEIFIGLFAEEE